jgi:predicted RNA-binding Zn ribbon-like protein
MSSWRFPFGWVLCLPRYASDRLCQIGLHNTIKHCNNGVTFISRIIRQARSMRAGSQKLEEWVDGFLFVANRPILDFLNTKPVLANGPTELLPDAHALERWLIASGMASSRRDKAFVRSWRNSAEATAFVKQLTGFRERLRAAVVRIESGSLPTAAFLAEVNSLLLKYPRHTAIHKRGAKLIQKTAFEPQKPQEYWAPMIDAVADLLSETEMSRLRQCESCVVHFFDTSKKGSRRWCSMNICGNKLKVASYQNRKRTAPPRRTK